MKTNFIEVTRSGQKILLNTSFIVSITPDKAEKAKITYLPSSNMANHPVIPNSYTVEESYEDIKFALLGS